MHAGAERYVPSHGAVVAGKLKNELQQPICMVAFNLSAWTGIGFIDQGCATIDRTRSAHLGISSCALPPYCVRYTNRRRRLVSTPPDTSRHPESMPERWPSCELNAAYKCSWPLPSSCLMCSLVKRDTTAWRTFGELLKPS